MNYGFVLQKMKVEDHVFWIAKSNDLKGCVGQGETAEEAIAELSINEAEWIATAKECGIEIPECPYVSDNEYSGKFTVRISKELHRLLAKQAELNSVSINSYVEEAIAAKVYNLQESQLNRLVSLMENVYRMSKKSILDSTIYSVVEFYKNTEDKWQKTWQDYLSYSKGVTTWKS